VSGKFPNGKDFEKRPGGLGNLEGLRTNCRVGSRTFAKMTEYHSEHGGALA